MKPFRQAGREQPEGENEPLYNLIGETDIEELASFEAGLGKRQNETLFKITTEIEDTKNTLKQAEQIVQKLKNRLQRLQDLQRILSK